MTLFQSQRGGQGLMNTYQFQSGVGLPDPSIMFQGVQGRGKGERRSTGTSTASEPKETKFTPGQTRRYNEEKIALEMEKKAVESKWMQIAEEEYQGRYGDLLRERKGEMLQDQLGLIRHSNQIEEGNLKREQNAKRLYELAGKPEFANNLILNNQGLAYGQQLTYDEQGRPVGTGITGWGHVTDEAFMPMTGSEAMFFLEQDDTALDSFIYSASEYNPSQWIDDVSGYVEGAVNSLKTTGRGGQEFNTKNASNLQALQQAIYAAPELRNSQNTSSLLNEVFQSGGLRRMDHRIRPDGTMESIPVPDEQGEVFIDPRRNPDEAIAQLLMDRAATEAKTRAKITDVTTATGLRRGGDTDKTQGRTPWLDRLTGRRNPDRSVVVTMGQKNLNRAQTERALNTIYLGNQQAENIAKAREEYLNRIESANKSPEELANGFVQYMRDRTPGLGELPKDAALRGYTIEESTPTSALSFTNTGTANFLRHKPRQVRIATALFQPAETQKLFAKEVEQRDENGNILKHGDYLLGIDVVDSDMIHSFAKSFNNRLDGSEEFLFPGANHNDLNLIRGDEGSPIMEFTGRVITNAPTASGHDGMYVEVLAYVWDTQLENLTINKLTGRGTKVREESVKADEYYDFKHITSSAGVGLSYGDMAEFIQSDIDRVLANSNGRKLYAVPMYVRVGLNQVETFDDHIPRRDQPRTDYEKELERETNKMFLEEQYRFLSTIDQRK